MSSRFSMVEEQTTEDEKRWLRSGKVKNFTYVERALSHRSVVLKPRWFSDPSWSLEKHRFFIFHIVYILHTHLLKQSIWR